MRAIIGLDIETTFSAKVPTAAGSHSWRVNEWLLGIRSRAIRAFAGTYYRADGETGAADGGCFAVARGTLKSGDR